MKQNSETQAPDALIRDAIGRVRRPLISVAVVSCFSNILMLTGPLFMMLVYDKVLASKSVPTLVALSVLALTLYAFYGFLESIRSRLLARIGATIDHRLAPRLFDATLLLPLHLGPMAKQHDPLQDLAQIRGFFMGHGPTAVFDLPWMPVYLAFLYIVHPVLGTTAIIGGMSLIAVAFVNELIARSQSREAGRDQTAAVVLADARRNAEAAAAMSMGDDLCARWAGGYVSATSQQRAVADHTAVFGAITKTARFILQSAMLAVGAYLVILGELSAGAMIAGSIIVSRAMAPVDQAIAYWRSYAAALGAFKRLRILIGCLPKVQDKSKAPPRPAKTVMARDLAIVPPGANSVTMAAGSFELEAGDALGVIGPSGCGKSTLARTLVGAWRPARGAVAFDGVEISRYSADTLGEAIGYLPQDVELFDGSIAENIARFRRGSTEEEIVAAARLAGVHEMIAAFPEGYDTQVGQGGMTLSGGQRQRIGLARAVFGDPFLVVLDEPNANLDPAGEECLTQAIQKLRQQGKIVVVVAHRPSAIFAANKILSLRNGRAEMFGPKKQVLSALFPRVGQPHKPAAAPQVSAPQVSAPQDAAPQEVAPQPAAAAKAPAPTCEPTRAATPAATPAEAPAAAPAAGMAGRPAALSRLSDALDETIAPSALLDLTAARERRAQGGSRSA